MSQKGDPFCLECHWEAFRLDEGNPGQSENNHQPHWNCPDDHQSFEHCEFDEACCDMDDCSVNCPSVCDGFVDCDASTACTAAHCEDTHCNDTGPACFDDHCCGDTGHSLESLLGFGGPLLDTNDLLSTEQSVKTGETEPVDQSAGNLLIPYPAGYCDHGSHFDCHTFPSPKDTDGTTNPYTQGVDPAEVLNMLGMCPDYSGCHNYLPDGNCHPGKLNGNPQSPFGCFHPLPHLNTHKSPVSQVKGPCRSHHCHHSRSSYAYSPYSRHSRSSVSSQLLSSPSETPLSREFSPEIDFHVCKWATDGVPCGASFPDAGALQDHLVSSHLLTVDGPKGNGFYCRWEGCHRPDEPFSQKSKLQGHFLTHSNYKNFKCKVCGKSFARQATLERHERSHRGEKPFKCPDCGKSFTDSSELKTHSRTHTGEKPFRCPYPGCDFQTGDSSNMSSHRLTHGERKHKCMYPDCGKSFTRPDQLKRHLRTAHKDNGNSPTIPDMPLGLSIP